MVLPFHRTKTTSCSGFDVANYCQRVKVFWIVVNILHSKKTLSPQIHFSDTAVSFEVHCWTATTDTKKLESEDLVVNWEVNIEGLCFITSRPGKNKSNTTKKNARRLE